MDGPARLCDWLLNQTPLRVYDETSAALRASAGPVSQGSNQDQRVNMNLNFSQATQEEREEFSTLLVKHNAQNCKSCGSRIVIEGCCSSGSSTESGTEFSAMSVACVVCGTPVVTKDSWYICGHDDVSNFLQDLTEEWD